MSCLTEIINIDQSFNYTNSHILIPPIHALILSSHTLISLIKHHYHLIIHQYQTSHITTSPIHTPTQPSYTPLQKKNYKNNTKYLSQLFDITYIKSMNDQISY